MRRPFLIVCGLIWTGMGLWGMVAPAAMVAPLGIPVEGLDAVADVRAMYGGLALACAAVVFWHLADDERVSNGLIFNALTVGSLGVCRLITMLLWMSATPLTVFLTVVELSTAAVATALARSE